MIEFYQQLIYTSLALTGIIIVLRQECINNFDKIEGTLGHEWYLIQSHIWSNDVKNTVKDLSDFITSAKNLKFQGKKSIDPWTDIFSETTLIRILTSRLNEISDSFITYNGFNNILSEYEKKNYNLKKWLEFSLIGTILFTVWSFIGIFLESQSNESIKISFLWYSFPFLIFLFCVIIVKLVQSYINVERIKKQIRKEKSKYLHVTQVKINV